MIQTGNAIVLSGLTKSFGKVRALDGLDFTVGTGEVHGFLGPNGAGKSTTMRILLGLLRADAGEARLLGGDPWADAVALHRRLAYVPGDVELWPNLTGGETIDLFGRLRGGFDPRRRKALIERFELDPTRKGQTYSRGNRQKVIIVAALASDAELLLLDEPTTGFDPLMEAVFQEVVGELRAEGRTILLSSHILAQVEKLADRISIIRKGKIVQTGTITDMRALARTTVEAETATPVSGIEALAGITGLQQVGRRIHFSVAADNLDAAIAHIGRHGFLALSSRPPTLEEIMLSQYGDNDRMEWQ